MDEETRVALEAEVAGLIREHDHELARLSQLERRNWLESRGYARLIQQIEEYYPGRERSGRDPLEEWTATKTKERGHTVHTRFEPYSLEQPPIDSGGFGTVYRARKDGSAETVALKVLRDDRQDAEGRGRFEREVLALRALQIRGVVRLLNAELDHLPPYYVMELVSGGPLAPRLLASRPREERLGLWRDICATVAAAHERGIVHRDLKPANILVDGELRPHLIDFGLARLPASVPGQEAWRTRTEGPRGTIAYMSPEQARGEWDDVDERTDVYALGLIGYEILSGGGFPIDAKVNPDFDALRDVLYQPPRALGRADPESRRGLERVVHRCLSKRASERYQNAGELLADIGRAERGEKVQGRRPSPATASFLHMRRRPLRTLAVAVLSLTTGLFAGLFLYIREQRAVLQELLDMRECAELRAELSDLSPDPTSIARLEGWISRAEDLMQRLPRHRHRQGRNSAGEVFASSSGSEDRRAQRARLVADLDMIHDTQLPGAHVRLASALEAMKRSLTDPATAAVWSAAINSIADPGQCPIYAGLLLAPQAGLLPLRRDLGSGLWEFAHLTSGMAAGVDPQQQLLIMDSTGVVLVLLPGGEFDLGAQAHSPEQPGYDALAAADEGPVRRVRLDPFFMSKYEMTQGQWLRVTGSNPSFYPELQGTDAWKLFPVENLSWTEAERGLARVGLLLPTEAQWEYAARASTRTPWWTGAERESLVGAVNLADQMRVDAGLQDPAASDWPGFIDGWAWHAPVDALGIRRPNLFGLVGVHGNVAEWCRDWLGNYIDAGPLDGEGSTDNPDARFRAMRGGFWGSTAREVRCAWRMQQRKEYVGNGVGVRPARRIDP